MRNFVKLAGGVAASALIAGSAFAADAIDEVPTPVETPYVAPVNPSWQGGYVGVFGGYDWADPDTALVPDNVDGWKGGAFAGYNFQNGNVVYGLEGDLGYSGAEETVGGASAELGAGGSLRARIGYAMDPVLVYGTAGIAGQNAEMTQGGLTDSNTHVGYTVGAGADALITENVFGRLEYRYSDYQDEDYTLGAGTVSSGFDTHSVNAGIGFKF